jgi:hypothetical protein
MGALGVDLARRDPAQRQQGRAEQRRGHKEHRPGREKVSSCAHHRGREPVPDGGKTGVASEPFADGAVSDQAEADRRHVRIARGGLDPGCFRGVPAMEGSGQKRNSVFADLRISALRYYKEAGITCRSLNRRATTLPSRRCAPNVAGGSKLRRALYGAKGGPATIPTVCRQMRGPILMPVQTLSDRRFACLPNF